MGQFLCVLVLLCILSTASAGYCLGDYYKFTSKVAVTNCDGAISHCGFQCCTWRWCIFCDCTDDHFGLAVTCVALEAAKSLEEACELVAIALNVSAYHLAPCTQSQMADLWLDAGCGDFTYDLSVSLPQHAGWHGITPPTKKPAPIATQDTTDNTKKAHVPVPAPAEAPTTVLQSQDQEPAKVNSTKGQSTPAGASWTGAPPGPSGPLSNLSSADIIAIEVVFVICLGGTVGSLAFGGCFNRRTGPQRNDPHSRNRYTYQSRDPIHEERNTGPFNRSVNILSYIKIFPAPPSPPPAAPASPSADADSNQRRDESANAGHSRSIAMESLPREPPQPSAQWPPPMPQPSAPRLPQQFCKV